MKYTFPRKVRLLTEPQFKQVVSNTKQKKSTEVFTVYYCDNNLTYPRLGVVVPKRNINLAVKRNQVKRVIREYFRINQKKFTNVDVLVVGKKRAETLSRKELEERLKEQLKTLERKDV